MHLDVTPLLNVGRRRRNAKVGSFIIANGHRENSESASSRDPYGFAAWFNERMPLDHDFVQMYEARSIEYERTVLAGIVDDDPVPPQEHPGRKSIGGDCASVVEDGGATCSTTFAPGGALRPS